MFFVLCIRLNEAAIRQTRVGQNRGEQEHAQRVPQMLNDAPNACPDSPDAPKARREEEWIGEANDDDDIFSLLGHRGTTNLRRPESSSKKNA